MTGEETVDIARQHLDATGGIRAFNATDERGSPKALFALVCRRDVAPRTAETRALFHADAIRKRALRAKQHGGAAQNRGRETRQNTHASASSDVRRGNQRVNHQLHREDNHVQCA